MIAITFETIVMQIVVTVIFTVIPVALYVEWLSRRHLEEKRQITRDLLDAHAPTHDFLIAIQWKIHEARTLEELRQWLQEESIRRLRAAGIEPVIKSSNDDRIPKEEP